MQIQLFPKFYQSLTADELCARCTQLNIDAPTVMIREGYWVTDTALEYTLKSFMNTAATHGMRPTYAQTALHMPALTENDDTLRILAANGIEQARVGMIGKDAVSDYRDLPDFFRAAAERTERAARAAGIRAVVQIHGNLYPHNATAVWQMVKDLDPQYIGVKLDPGNNLTFEGYERFDYQIRLLREYITALGVKDTAIERANANANTDGKGWRRRFVPATEGLADYDLILRELQGVGFDGPCVLMPFYEERTDFDDALAGEVAYLRRIMQTISAEVSS